MQNIVGCGFLAKLVKRFGYILWQYKFALRATDCKCLVYIVKANINRVLAF